MCSRCDEIDRKIDRLKNLAGRITDQQTLDGIAALIAELETGKRELHTQEGR
jgi:hypothetical protein